MISFRENGKGKIFGKVCVGKTSLVIENVHLAKGLKYNLLSINQLYDAFKSSTCLNEDVDTNEIFYYENRKNNVHIVATIDLMIPRLFMFSPMMIKQTCGI